MEQWYYKQIAARAHRSQNTGNLSLTKKVLIIFSLSRLYFLISARFASLFVKPELGYLGNQVSRGEPNWLWVWANLDGRHFVNIAQLGYSGTNFAFFPLYPFLINFFSPLGLTPIYIGILISSFATLLSLHFIQKIIRLDGYAKKDEKPFFFETSLLLFFFPLSFILNSVYSDALFLLLTTTSFYFARSGKWLAAGIFAFLSSLTRLTGMALIPALALEWWIQRKNKKLSYRCLIAPLGALLGLLSYFVYLQLQFGSWRLFQTSMRAWRFEQIVFLPQVFYRYLKIFLTVSPQLIVYWVALLEFVAFLSYIVLAVYVTKKIRASYGLFMIILLLIRTFNGTFAGMPRYLIQLFPAFLGLAYFLRHHPKIRIVYYPATILLGAILTSLFVQGLFVP